MAVHAKDLATPQVKIWFTQRHAWTKHPAAAIRFSIWGAATRFTGYRDGIRLSPLMSFTFCQALSAMYFIWTCGVDTWFCCISLPWTLETVHGDYRWRMTIQYMTYMTHASHLSLKHARILRHRCGERPTMSSLRIVDLAGSDWRGWKLLSSIGSFVDFCWLSMTFRVCISSEKATY